MQYFYVDWETGEEKIHVFTEPEVAEMREDFKPFLEHVWRFLGLPPPTPVQYDIADYLQHGPRRKIILAYRGVGKSWITAVFVLWLLWNDPQTKILVVSASKQRSDDFSTFCLRLLADFPLLQDLYPTDDQRQSKVAFDVKGARPDHAPSVKSAGITGQITGSRANHIVADDIEIPANSETQLMRDKLSESIKEFDAVLKPGGIVTYLGTPQTEMSIYNNLPDRGYATCIWPVRIPESTDKYGGKLAPFIIEKMEHGASAGDPVDPARFDDKDLVERELSYGRSGFMLQFMLDTTLSDAEKFPLKLRDLIVLDLNPKKGPIDLIWTGGDTHVLNVPTIGLEGDRYHSPMLEPTEFEDFQGTVTFVDPSGRGKDETAWAHVAMLHGVLFLLDVVGRKGGYTDDILKEILQSAKRYGSTKILVEPNFGDGMFARVLSAHRQDHYNVTIEDAPWSRQQKERRIIDTLEPVMNQNRLVVDKRLIERDYKSTESYPVGDQQRYRLFYQMTRITGEKGALVADDRLDAVAGAVAYWLEQMSTHEASSVRSSRSRLLDEELKRHIQFQQGRSVVRKSPTLAGIKTLKGL